MVVNGPKMVLIYFWHMLAYVGVKYHEPKIFTVFVINFETFADAFLLLENSYQFLPVLFML